jgi:16S rRNA (guanine527-N7)-methyltransferase
VSEPLPPPPPVAREVFGSALPLAQRYAGWLAEDGVVRGLLGPREVPRIWERHLVNCAVVAPALPPGARVVDVGSGAGVPGIPLVLVRPDLQMVLVEPLLRRVGFLAEVVADLALPVEVVRARAEQLEPACADAVVARAVAPLPRLVRATLPVLRPGGVLVALKGSTVDEELQAAEAELRVAGAAAWEVREFGRDPTRAVVVVAGAGRTAT